MFMPLYEIGLIIDPEATPEDESSILERIEGLITDAEGEVVDKDSWGRRQLAYPIKKKNHGIYHFWKFDVGGQVLKSIDFELRTNDMVMRSLVLNLDHELRRYRKGERLIKAKAAKRAAKAKAVAEEATEAS
jgi:small subunit ribosomal protein S6